MICQTLAVLKSNTNVIFLYDLWFYIKAINNIYSKNLYPFSTHQTFSSGLIRPFAISFSLCTMERRHSRDILLSNVLLSLLQFFQFFFIAIFTPPNLNFFSTSSFSLIYNTFSFENLRHVHLVKNTCLIIFPEKLTCG